MCFLPQLLKLLRRILLLLLLPPETPQACRPPRSLAVIEVIIFIAIFRIVYRGRPPLRYSSSRYSGGCRRGGLDEVIGVFAEAWGVGGDEGLWRVVARGRHVGGVLELSEVVGWSISTT